MFLFIVRIDTNTESDYESAYTSKDRERLKPAVCESGSGILLVYIQRRKCNIAPSLSVIVMNLCLSHTLAVDIVSSIDIGV